MCAMTKRKAARVINVTNCSVQNTHPEFKPSDSLVNAYAGLAAAAGSNARAIEAIAKAMEGPANNSIGIRIDDQ